MTLVSRIRNIIAIGSLLVANACADQSYVSSDYQQAQGRSSDASGQVQNNDAAQRKDIHKTPLIDLILTNVEVNPNPIVYGDDFSWRYTITNNSTVNLEKIEVYSSQDVTAGFELISLKPGEQKTINHNGANLYHKCRSKVEEFDLLIHVDSDEKIQESNESNNMLKVTIPVVGYIDDTPSELPIFPGMVTPTVGLEDYPGFFVGNNVSGKYQFNGYVVIPGHPGFTKNILKKYEAMANEIIDSMKYDGTQVTHMSSLKKDYNIYSPYAQNMIVLGSPCVNSVSAELYGNPSDCDKHICPGQARIDLFQSKNGNRALVIGGYGEDITSLAAKILAFKNSDPDFKGKSLIVEGQ